MDGLVKGVELKFDWFAFEHRRSFVFAFLDDLFLNTTFPSTKHN